jgi:hypothetical protein
MAAISVAANVFIRATPGGLLETQGFGNRSAGAAACPRAGTLLQW